MLTVFLIILTVAVVTGGILYGVNFWLAKKNGEVIAKRYIISISVLVLIYLGLFAALFFISNNKINEVTAKMNEMKVAQKAEITRIRKFYAKEMALANWKNKVFNTNKDMQQALAKAQADYKLTDQEVRNWKSIAENNTLEKLMPKNNSREILNEFQTRLKNSLNDIKSGQTLMTSDIRMLTDNINAIRFVGKEYEKVLDSFKDLYNTINGSTPGDMPMPKQQKFLFFPIKQKEYNQLVQQYYESKGNAKATEQIAVQLKETIEKAEEQFKQINQKFESNLSFLQANSDSVTYNSEKLQKLIEAALSEVNIINESQKGTNIKINTNKKN
jgi:O6-methylguanine-DNA--protein-cysteine methyltransferase